MNNHHKSAVNLSRTVIHLNYPLYIFLVIPFFKPGSLAYIAPFVDILFDLWLIAVSLLIGFLYLASGRLSKIMLAIIAFEVVLALSTFLNAGDYYGLTVNILRTIPFCMLIELGTRQNPKGLIKALITVLGIECLINSVTILIFPEGIYETVEQFTQTIGWRQTQNFFLGYDNTHVLYILPLLCVLLIYANHSYLKRRYKIAVIFLFTATVYVTWSAASVVCISVFLLIFLMSEFHLNFKIFKFKYYFIIIIVAFLGVVIFRLQDIFADFIVGFLGKDLSFTGRTFIWDRTLKVFMRHPFAGVGRHTRVETYMVIGAPHPHNLILRILYESGIVGMISFLAIVLLGGKSLRATFRNKDCFVSSLTLFCFLLLFLVESFDDLSSFFAMLTMAYHINLLTEGLNKPEARKSVRHFVLFRKGNKVGSPNRYIRVQE